LDKRGISKSFDWLKSLLKKTILAELPPWKNLIGRKLKSKITWLAEYPAWTNPTSNSCFKHRGAPSYRKWRGRGQKCLKFFINYRVKETKFSIIGEVTPCWTLSASSIGTPCLNSHKYMCTCDFTRPTKHTHKLILFHMILPNVEGINKFFIFKTKDKLNNKERFFFLFKVNRSLSNITTGSVDHSCLLSTTALWYEILLKMRIIQERIYVKSLVCILLTVRMQKCVI
jgi:hypothetical protein